MKLSVPVVTPYWAMAKVALGSRERDATAGTSEPYGPFPVKSKTDVLLEGKQKS